MATWSQKQQLKYFAGFVLALLILIGVPTYVIVYDAPTCSDGLKNGDEEGVDCGGVCEAICPFETRPPSVVWARSFEVVDGFYNAVALIENPNVSAEARSVPYTFKLRDENNILLAERSGRAYLPPEPLIPIFEAGIQTGESVPTRTTFSFLGEPDWQRRGSSKRQLQTSARSVDETATDTRLSATLTNTTFDDITDIRIVGIVFGRDGNARAVSETVLGLLKAGEEETIVFTWPGTFADEIVRSEIYPIQNP